MQYFGYNSIIWGVLQLRYQDFDIASGAEVIKETVITEKRFVMGISRSYLDACPFYLIFAI